MHKRLLLSISMMGILSFCSSISLSSQNDFKAENLRLSSKQLVRSDEKQETIVSYVAVLDSYYDLAVGNVAVPTITFDRFMDSYYSKENTSSLYEFTLDIADENGNFSSVYQELYGGEYGIEPASNSGGSSTGGGSSSGDANYILKNSDENFTTPSSAFARIPIYNAFDYSSVLEGDIIWETETILFNSGHDALIVDMDHASPYGTYIQTIEAVGGGVQRGFLDDQRMVDFRCEILRVKGRTDFRADEAIYFAERQIGKKYSLNTLRLNKSINSTEWYCSEMVYASWKYAGIDVGVKNGQYLQHGCLPNDIAQSDNVEKNPMPYYTFLTVSVISKSGRTWKIRIYNPTSEYLTVYYNSKMCFYEDAKNWTGLADIQKIKIPSKEQRTVEISENWFANSITVSFVVEKSRVITYADDLNTNGSLNVEHNIINS